ncbi:hypothetical protein C8J57DRAFT_1713598 [Mycena rebaudengoi]|nr:hypothetical protein C8J57DRAFT_1574728 [Mycena rebaudengoi]KAJ7278068.1 hypothetical protein C8J57DRAFT_1713598 [Mycena rebaudengoi]
MVIYAALVFQLAALISPALCSSNVTPVVYVGSDPAGPGSPYQFIPPTVAPNVGDTILFRWNISGNHSVTESSFSTLCQKMPESASPSTGDFVFKSPNDITTPERKLAITSAEPKWFFCEQTIATDLCRVGMVFAVNPPTTGERTFAAFQAAAVSGVRLYSSSLHVYSQAPSQLNLRSNPDGEITKKKPPIAAIVGGALGGLSLLSLSGFVLLFCRRKFSRKPVDNLSEAEQGLYPDVNLLDDDGQPARDEDASSQISSNTMAKASVMDPPTSALDTQPADPFRDTLSGGTSTDGHEPTAAIAPEGSFIQKVRQKLFGNHSMGTTTRVQRSPTTTPSRASTLSVDAAIPNNLLQEVVHDGASPGDGDIFSRLRLEFFKKTPHSEENVTDPQCTGSQSITATEARGSPPRNLRHSITSATAMSRRDPAPTIDAPSVLLGALGIDEPATDYTLPPPDDSFSASSEATNSNIPMSDSEAPTRSLSTMKRAQTRALSRDQQRTGTATDVLIQTIAGLQLLPGQGRVVSTDESTAVASELRDLREYIRVLEADLAAGRRAGEAPLTPPPGYEN